MLRSIAVASFAVVAVSATQCTCPDPTPCQHLAGTTCYAQTVISEWQGIADSAGHRACPAETRHCACDCSDATPCRSVDKLSGDVTCIGTITMYGQSVCPLGAAHCLNPKATGLSALTGNPVPLPAGWALPIVPSIPTPPGASAVCKCAGTKPCWHATANSCTQQVNGSCPIGSVPCKCGCTGDGSHPCQHNAEDQCFPAEYDGANKRCPASTTQCETHGVLDVAAAVPDNLCRCGGSAPCQDNHDSTGTSCHAMLAGASGVLACWHGHRTQCDCDCKPETPCRYVDPASKKGYCFATEVDAVSGGAACPENTKKCNAPAPLKVADVLAATEPTPAPTPPPNSVHVDASMVQTEPPTPAPLPNVINCAYAGWSDWSACTRKCGGGTKIRSVKVTVLPGHGGVSCPKDQVMACNERVCSNHDCQVSDWGDWTPCTRNCGGGLQYKNPTVLLPAQDYGAACPAPIARKCNTGSCFISTPMCHCDPLAGEAVNPRAAPPNKGDLECENHDGMIRVFHPNAPSTGVSSGSAGYHNCKYSVAKGCKCCTCSALECSATDWGSWSPCDSALYDGKSVITRTRTRQAEGKTVAAEGAVCPHVTDREVCTSAVESGL